MTVLPITFEYLAIEFLLNKDEASVKDLHPYLEKRIAVNIEINLMTSALEMLEKEKLIEIKGETYIALQDKRNILNNLYARWGEEWKTMIETENPKLKSEK